MNPQDATTLALVPSQHKRCRIDGLSSWLEAWNVYLRTILSFFPQLAPDLLAYQDQMCKFSRKFKASAWLVYDTAFHYMAASNLSIAWGKVNEQLNNNILNIHNLPYCIHCHSYGHSTLSCSTRSKPSQSFRSLMAYSPSPLPETPHTVFRLSPTWPLNWAFPLPQTSSWRHPYLTINSMD